MGSAQRNPLIHEVGHTVQRRNSCGWRRTQQLGGRACGKVGIFQRLKGTLLGRFQNPFAGVGFSTSQRCNRSRRCIIGSLANPPMWRRSPSNLNLPSPHQSRPGSPRPDLDRSTGILSTSACPGMSTLSEPVRTAAVLGNRMELRSHLAHWRSTYTIARSRSTGLWQCRVIDGPSRAPSMGECNPSRSLLLGRGSRGHPKDCCWLLARSGMSHGSVRRSCRFQEGFNTSATPLPGKDATRRT